MDYRRQVKFWRLTVVVTGAVVSATAAQAPVRNPSQVEMTRDVQGMPVYRLTVVSRTTSAINYRHRSGATKIDFRGTPLLPLARGEAKVESKKGYIEIEVEFDELQPASRYGAEYLTYVLWAMTPEGRANNLGELLLSGTKGKLNVTTELQAFALVVTAEPYFAVTQPSDLVVMENVIRKDTVGKIEQVEAKYELLKRGQYTLNVDPSQLQPRVFDRNTPLELHEARNAVALAQFARADRYAADTYQKAAGLLRQAEDYLARKAGNKPVIMTAREAVQTAEDSRLIAIQRADEERLATERREAVERQAAIQAKADEETLRRAEAESQRLAAEQAAQESRRQKADAERAKAEADRARADAEAARVSALAQQQSAQLEAEKARLAAGQAERLRQQAEADRMELRVRLQRQLNAVLETRESARGLIVNMSDVLFDFGKHTLQPGAREKLAKVAGIILSHPGLKLEVEGHTDSVGSDDSNQRLSERRAQSVREYLMGQGILSSGITSRGFGEGQPVASNDTPAGRQQNRRVELVVSGEPIGAGPATGL